MRGIAELRALRGDHERAVQAAGARVRGRRSRRSSRCRSSRSRRSSGRSARSPGATVCSGLKPALTPDDAAVRASLSTWNEARAPRPLVAELDGDALAGRGVQHERLGRRRGRPGRRPPGADGTNDGAGALLAAGVGQVDGRDLEPRAPARRSGRAGRPRRRPAGGRRCCCGCGRAGGHARAGQRLQVVRAARAAPAGGPTRPGGSGGRCRSCTGSRRRCPAGRPRRPRGWR